MDHLPERLTPSASSRARIVVLPLLAGAVVVVLALTFGVVTQEPGARPTAATPTPTLTASAPPSVSSGVGRGDALRLSLSDPSAPWQEGDHLPDLGAVQEVLDQRARAAVDGDVEAFTETGLVDAITRPQAESIAALPIERWSYTLGGGRFGRGVVMDAETATARETYGSNAYVIRATLRYAIDGYDRTTVTTLHAVTVSFQGGTWKILRDLPIDGSKELWDFGGITVVNGNRSLVVGLGEDPPSTQTLSGYAAYADIGVRDVTAVWGRDWQRRVLIVAAPTTAAMADALGRDTAEYRQIAAVTTADHGGGTRVSRGDRVFVNPRAFAKLGSQGRTIVLRHEITHVASLAAVDDDMPTWMEEGFADYLGYRNSGVSESAIVRELATWVRAGARPTDLPSEDDYDGRNGNLVESYEQSWLAADMLADQYGEEQLVRLYRTMTARTGSDPEQGTAEAFEEVLGISFESFVREWRAEVRALG